MRKGPTANIFDQLPGMLTSQKNCDKFVIFGYVFFCLKEKNVVSVHIKTH